MDSGVEEQSEISVYYDPMVAKLIVHAGNRQLGLERMARALSEFLIMGVRTSIPLHQWLMAHPDVRSGNVDTAWLERTWSGPSFDDASTEIAAIAAALLTDNRSTAATTESADHVGDVLRSNWRIAARRAALS